MLLGDVANGGAFDAGPADHAPGEIGFWLILLGGLLVRYALRHQRLGMALLAGAPVVDLVLLAATALDLRRGGEAAVPHALAAVYIGISVAWGQSMIRWADTRFSHRFAGGPPPQPRPRTGRAHAARERREWLRHLLAWGTGCALLALALLLVGDLDRSQALLRVAALWTFVLGIDFLISFSYTVWPRREHTRSQLHVIKERASYRSGARGGMPRAQSKSGTEEAHLARPSVAPKNIRGELGVTSDANQLLPAAESCHGNQWVEASGGADIGSVANRRFGLRKWSAVAAKLPCCRDR